MLRGEICHVTSVFFYLSNIKHRYVAVPPLSIIKKIDKEKSGIKSGNKSILINGKSVEVTDEVYKVYVPPKPEFELYLDRQAMDVVGAKLVAVYGDNKYHSASGVYFCSS